MDNFIKLPQDESHHIISLITNNKGIVYGGYIRDIINNEIPNDIDAVILENVENKIIQELEHDGYFKHKIDNYLYRFTKNNCKSIDLSVEREYTMEGIVLSPLSAPDFDVNLLAFDGNKIYNWTGWDNVNEIIKNIRSRHCRILNPDLNKERIEKMKQRGWTIL
jgi:hypothetical protein